MPIDKVITPLGAGGGTVTGGQNIGGEEEIFKQLNGTVMEFRTLKGIGGLVVAQNGNVLEISAPGGGAGTINDAANVGTGEGIFKQVAVDVLEFYSLEGVDDVEIALVGNNIQIGAPLIANFQPQLDSLFDGVIQLQSAVADLDQDVVDIQLAYVTLASNEGVGDFGFFIQKTINNLEFKTFSAGSNGIEISEGANVITFDLEQDLKDTASPTFANLNISAGGAIRTGTSAGNTLLFQARDVDGAAWTTFATLTANNTPSFDLSLATLVGGKTIAQGFTPYTPTLTNVTNVAASTTSDFGYCRIGNYVFGGGRITIDPTSASVATELGISLPIASNFTLFTQCTGSVISTASASLCAAIKADTTNDRMAVIYVNTADTASREMMVKFFYEVL